MLYRGLEVWGKSLWGDAMLALFAVNVPAIQAIAFGAIAVVFFAVLATLSLLPVVLSMLGERINKGRPGPLISGAAVLMIAVFTGFAFSSMLPIQTLGFGMAVAILLDATVVRLIIVPAAMKLLGRWNWWFPGKKERVADTSNRLQKI